MTGQDIALDEVDLRILNALQQDCSVTNAKLAELVHVSPPTSLRRVRDLVAGGVIERQVAILDPVKVSSRITAITEITLDVQTTERLSAFESLVAGAPEVQQCYRVSPGPDFILILQVPDMPAYQALAHRLFSSHANIRNVRTFFSTFRSKFSTSIQLG